MSDGTGLVDQMIAEQSVLDMPSVRAPLQRAEGTINALPRDKWQHAVILEAEDAERAKARQAAEQAYDAFEAEDLRRFDVEEGRQRAAMKGNDHHLSSLTDAEAARHQRTELRRLAAIPALQGLVTASTDRTLIQETALEALESDHDKTVICLVPLAIDALERIGAKLEAKTLRTKWLEWRAAHQSPIVAIELNAHRRDLRKRELRGSFSRMLRAFGYRGIVEPGDMVIGEDFERQKP